MTQSLEPVSPEQYAELFLTGEHSAPEAAPTARAAAALETALDIRKFEIELYWKRAAYFWAFIAAALIGYTSTLKEGLDKTAAPVFFANMGFAFSFAWLCINRGSKFWQGNWEKHVDLLEDNVQGPLYKVIAFEAPRKFKILKAFPFSVSKINQIISAYVAIFWFALVIKSLVILYSSPLNPCLSEIAKLHPSAVLATLGGFSFPFVAYGCGRSSFAGDAEDKPNGWHLGKRSTEI
jgi:hypothetical protein